MFKPLYNTVNIRSNILLPHENKVQKISNISIIPNFL